MLRLAVIGCIGLSGILATSSLSTVSVRLAESEEQFDDNLLIQQHHISPLIRGSAEHHLKLDQLQRGVGAEVAASHKAVLKTALPGDEWDGAERLGSDGSSECHFRSASYHQDVHLCLRPYPDLVSEAVEASGSWQECGELVRAWVFGMMGSTNEDVFLDIGANIGMCSVEMAARTSAVEVFAFEPLSSNLFYLTGTFLQNPQYLDRLRLFPVGLGDANATLPIFSEPGNAGHSTISKPLGERDMDVPERTGSVIVRRLDDLILPPYPKIRLAKIDVEGFETRVLQGGRQLFSSGAVRSVYFELSPFLKGQGSSRLELVNLILEFGFRFLYQDRQPMRQRELKKLVCHECAHCFANVFAVVAHHVPNTQPQRLSECHP